MVLYLQNVMGSQNVEHANVYRTGLKILGNSPQRTNKEAAMKIVGVMRHIRLTFTTSKITIKQPLAMSLTQTLRAVATFLEIGK